MGVGFAPTWLPLLHKTTLTTALTGALILSRDECPIRSVLASDCYVNKRPIIGTSKRVFADPNSMLSFVRIMFGIIKWVTGSD